LRTVEKWRIVVQKAPFKFKVLWTLRIHPQMAVRVRELTLLNLGIHSKLRGCDLTPVPREVVPAWIRLVGL